VWGLGQNHRELTAEHWIFHGWVKLPCLNALGLTLADAGTRLRRYVRK